MKRTKSNKRGREKAPEISPAVPEDGLTDRQRRAVLAILEAPNMEAAARAAGVVRSTLYEWLKLPAFKARLEEARAVLYREGIDVLKGAAAQAARVLIELLGSRNENTRRLTAVSILAAGMKASEAQDLEARIEKLEELLGAAGTGAGPGVRLSMDELKRSEAACRAAGGDN